MVDGVDVGVDLLPEGDKRMTLFSEGFHDADLLCIIPEEQKWLKSNKGDETKKGFMLFAIYGDNKIVSSFIPKNWIDGFINDNKPKIVLVRKKPYIISGELGVLYDISRRPQT